MTPLLFVSVALAGGVGAGARYAVDVAVTRMLGANLPWGILLVNVTGAFALGVVSAGVVDATGVWVLGVGLLGGYTTFSSVAVSTALLAEERRTIASTLYAVGTFVASVAASIGGLAAGMVGG
jgi:CrcB protein